MKRIGYIYEKIYEIDNIIMAIERASKGKRKRGDVKRVLKNKEHYANKISEMLKNQTYKPNPYIKCEITGGMTKKVRTISKPKFYPDQIIHWAILLQIQPILLKGVYKYSCGSIPNRGLHYGKRYLQPIIQHKFYDTKFYMQLDIKKFYPSIKPKILMKMLFRKIKDKKVLRLIWSILKLQENLPIGTLLSQWFANFYLERLDHIIKEDCKIKYYLRYIDDMVLFNHSKKRLKQVRDRIKDYLNKIGLQLKFKICKTDLGVDILGFRFFRHTTILRKRLMLKISKTIRRIYKRKSYTPHNCMSAISYLGRLRHCNTYKFYMRWIKPYIKINLYKTVIKLYQKGAINVNDNYYFTKQHKTQRMGRGKQSDYCLS